MATSIAPTRKTNPTTRPKCPPFNVERLGLCCFLLSTGFHSIGFLSFSGLSFGLFRAALRAAVFFVFFGWRGKQTGRREETPERKKRGRKREEGGGEEEEEEHTVHS